jgi:DNA-directed RNA polymerase subunit RPC12/RpoP
MIAFHCPSCHAEIEVPDNYAGRSANCPTCNHKIHVPAGGVATDEGPPEEMNDPSTNVIRVEGRAYQVPPKFEGMLFAAAAVLALSPVALILPGLGMHTYTPWGAAGLCGAAVALFGLLLLLPAHYSIRRSHGRKTGGKFAFIILGAGVLLLVAYLCVALVSFTMADRSSSVERLQRVAKGLGKYAADNGGALPDAPETLVHQKYIPASTLTCPDVPGLHSGTPTYVYYDRRLDLRTDKTPFPGDLIVFVDGIEHEVKGDKGTAKVFFAIQLDALRQPKVGIVRVPADQLKDILKQQAQAVGRVIMERNNDKAAEKKK